MFNFKGSSRKIKKTEVAEEAKSCINSLCIKTASHELYKNFSSFKDTFSKITWTQKSDWLRVTDEQKVLAKNV